MKKILVLSIILNALILYSETFTKENAIAYYKNINRKDKLVSIHEKNGRVINIALTSKNIKNDDLKYIRFFDEIQGIHLSTSSITDEGLQYLKGLEKLRILNLDDTNITDEGLKYLKDLKSLRELDLFNTKVTDKGIQQLSGLKELNTLLLHGTKVTKKGIDELKKKLPDCYITLESREELH